MNELFSPTALASQVLLYYHVGHTCFHIVEKGCQMVQLLPADIAGQAMFVSLPSLNQGLASVEQICRAQEALPKAGVKLTDIFGPTMSADKG